MSNKVGEIFQISVAFSKNLILIILSNNSFNIFPWIVTALTEAQVKRNKPNNRFCENERFKKNSGTKHNLQIFHKLCYVTDFFKGIFQKKFLILQKYFLHFS